jgi:hypothetical protein
MDLLMDLSISLKSTIQPNPAPRKPQPPNKGAAQKSGFAACGIGSSVLP